MQHKFTSHPSVHSFFVWCLILVPVSCAISRFASDVLLSLVAAGFLLHTLLTRDVEWMRHRWVQVALGLWVYVVLLSFIAPDMEKAFGRSLSWIRFPLFAAGAAYWLLCDARVRHRLILSLSVAVGFMLLDTALQYFTGTDILGWESIPAEGSPRLTGPFSAPRVGIMLVWMSVPVVAYWLMGAGNTLPRPRAMLLGACYAVGFLSVVFMSGERMALLLTGLGFVLAFFLLPISKLRMTAIALVGIVAMGLLAYTNQGLIARHVGSTSEVVDDFGGSDYGMIWHSAWEVSKDHPLLGVGLRQFRVVCPDAAYGPLETVERRCNQHPHNIYLEWLSESGLIGLSLFVAMLAFICRDGVLRYRELRYHPVYLGLLITLFIRLWPLASNTSFFTAWSAVPMWLIIGWLLAVSTHEPAHSKSTQGGDA